MQAVANGPDKRGAFATATHVVRSDGVSGLYRGVSLGNIYRLCPRCTIADMSS